eukprot:scaffold5160_cov152-Cylindrotheca_fusiformis.AAC.6
MANSEEEDDVFVIVERTADRLKYRFQKTILTRIQLFNGIYKAVIDKNESGKTDSDRMQDALDNFEVKTGQPFAFTECWKVLKKMPKFDPMLHQQEGGQSNSGDENSSSTINHIGTVMGAGTERPIGTKKAKAAAKTNKKNVQPKSAKVDAGTAFLMEKQKLEQMTVMNETNRSVLLVMQHNAIKAIFQDDIDTQMQMFNAFVSSGNNEEVLACQQEIKRLQAECNMLLSQLMESKNPDAKNAGAAGDLEEDKQEVDDDQQSASSITSSTT